MSDQNTTTPRRNQRGYRKYRDGTLNVTPIGHEIALVKQNAKDSPFLRLPAELRRRVYEYVLGKDAIRLPNDDQTVSTSSLRRFALLQVSRQIYLETAQLPFNLKVIEANFLPSLQRFVRLGIMKHVEELDLLDVFFPTKQDLENIVPRDLLPKLTRVTLRCSEGYSLNGRPRDRYSWSQVDNSRQALSKHLGNKVVINVLYKEDGE
jgi:hypothetical protein